MILHLTSSDFYPDRLNNYFRVYTLYAILFEL